MTAYTLNDLAQQFRTVFNLGDDVDVSTLNYRSIPAWDSLGHMQLVSAIENAFGIMLETEQLIGMSSFQKAVEVLHSHGIEL